MAAAAAAAAESPDCGPEFHAAAAPERAATAGRGAPCSAVAMCRREPCSFASTAVTHRDRSWSKTGKDLRKMADAFERSRGPAPQTPRLRTRWVVVRASDWLVSSVLRLVRPDSLRRASAFARHTLNRLFTAAVDYLAR